jgi:pSer/pThr/pTyr-binding forkhead associated (FHA) protein
VFPIRKKQVVIGRGGKSFWVDLKLDAPADVSREHCRIRRDPATGQFFLKDVSQFGTTIDGKKVTTSLETKDGQNRDANVEAPIPSRAVIGLADTVFLNFEAASEGTRL